MADVAEIRAYWSEIAPPLHISALAIAASLGIDLTPQPAGDGGPGHFADAPAPPLSGPSIAELAAMVPSPVAGGDTWAASQAALRAIHSKTEKREGGDGVE